MIDAMCSGSAATSSADSYAGMASYVYPQEYLSNIADIHNCDAAIIAIQGGCDKKTTLRQCIENLQIDSSKMLGFVWIAQ